jgi:hypothetical protein
MPTRCSGLFRHNDNVAYTDGLAGVIASRLAPTGIGLERRHGLILDHCRWAVGLDAGDAFVPGGVR